MGKDSTTRHKINAQIRAFSDRLSQGLPKPKRRLIHEVVYGIQASKDVKISNVARALQEPIALLKTETRLCRQLKSPGLDEHVRSQVLQEGGPLVNRDTVLACDLSDVRKDFAKKMEYLGRVYDGSTGAKGVPGYWLLHVVGAQVEGERLIPLWLELFSQNAPEFVSENKVLAYALRTVSQSLGGQGIWAFDRGMDRRKFYETLFQENVRFVVRARGDRHVQAEGKKRALRWVARACAPPSVVTVTVNKEGHEETKTLEVGEVAIGLPDFPDVPLRLVVVKGYGEEPLLLLTNLREHTPEKILHIYLTRWKCEESFRFLKQAYHVEDIRVLSYTSLRHLIALVGAVFCFVSVVLGHKLRLNLLLKKIYQKAKRFFGIPSFKHYAIADGIYALLVSAQKGIAPFLKSSPHSVLYPSLFPDL